MQRFGIALLFFSIYCGTTVAKDCPDDTWTPYEGKKCLKILETTYENYVNANDKCLTLAVGATLVVVKDLELQTILSESLHILNDNIWLGAKFDDTEKEYKWVDGTSLTYHNFQTGFPRNQSGLCVVMHPPNAKKFREVDVKWQDVPCTRPNLVLCQIDLPFDIERAEREIQSLRTDLKIVGEQLEIVGKRVVPVGFLYTQYPNKDEPTSLWPDLTWEDVTTEYANMFFRAMGEESASWGAPQEACVPRISKVEYKSNAKPAMEIEIPENDWSTYVLSGYYSTTPNHSGLRYNTVGCEVRPKNFAIKIWKRMA